MNIIFWKVLYNLDDVREIMFNNDLYKTTLCEGSDDNSSFVYR